MILFVFALATSELKAHEKGFPISRAYQFTKSNELIGWFRCVSVRSDAMLKKAFLQNMD